MVTPFGIILIDKNYLSKNAEKYQEIPLGTTKEGCAAGDLVQQMAQVDGKSNVKLGKIRHSDRNYANRYGAMFQATFDQQSNYPGAPLFDDTERCIGLHIFSSETDSFNLKIDYIVNYLAFFNNDKYDGKGYKRCDIGLSLSLLVVGSGKTNYHLPNQVAQQIIDGQVPSGGPPETIIVSGIVPLFEVEKTMQVGDIITKVDGVLIASDLLKYDEIINSKCDSSIDIEFYRNGNKMTTTIKKVYNTLDANVNRYCKFADSFFIDLTPLGRSCLNTKESGIYLTYSAPGINGMISSQTSITKNNFILSKVDGTEINNLDNLLEFLKRYCSAQSVIIEGYDLNKSSTTKVIMPLDLTFDSNTIHCYEKSTYGGWVSKSIDLSEYCKGREEGFINVSDDPLYEQSVSTSPSSVPSTTSSDLPSSKGDSDKSSSTTQDKSSTTPEKTPEKTRRSLRKIKKSKRQEKNENNENNENKGDSSGSTDDIGSDSESSGSGAGESNEEKSGQSSDKNSSNSLSALENLNDMLQQIEATETNNSTSTVPPSLATNSTLITTESNSTTPNSTTNLTNSTSVNSTTENPTSNSTNITSTPINSTSSITLGNTTTPNSTSQNSTTSGDSQLGTATSPSTNSTVTSSGTNSTNTSGTASSSTSSPSTSSTGSGTDSTTSSGTGNSSTSSSSSPSTSSTSSTVSNTRNMSNKKLLEPSKNAKNFKVNKAKIGKYFQEANIFIK